MKIFRLFTLLLSLTLSLSSLGQHTQAAKATTAPAAQPAKNRCVLNLLNVLPLRDIQNLVVDYLDGYSDPEVIIPAQRLRNNLSHPITTTNFSPTGQYLVSTGDPEVDLQIWKTVDMKLTKHQVLSKFDTKLPDMTRTAAFSPDSQFLVTSKYGEVSIWKLINDKFILHQEFTLNNNNIDDVAFSSDGKYLMLAGIGMYLLKFDQKSEKFNILSNVEKDDALPVPIISVLFSASGSHFIVASHKKIALCKVTDQAILCAQILKAPKEIDDETFPPLHLAFSSQEKYLILAGGNALYRYKFNALQEDPEVLQMDDDDANAVINGMVSSPDRKFLALDFYSDKPTEIWQIKSDQWTRCQVLENIQSSVITQAFSPDNIFLVTGGRDGSLVRWRNQAAEIMLAEKSCSK